MSLLLRHWLLGGLLALVLVGWWLWGGPPEAPAPAAPEAVQGADYRIDGLELVSMDAGGRPAYRLQAARLLHFPDDDHAELEKPVMHIFRADARDWILRAESGRVASGNRKVLLQGGVHMARAGEAAGDRLTVDLPRVTLYPARRLAVSAAPVVIRGAAQEIRGVGLRADLNTGRLSLLADVRGRHEL